MGADGVVEVTLHQCGGSLTLVEGVTHADLVSRAAPDVVGLGAQER